MSDILGPVDFAFGLINSLLDLPNGQVKFFKKFKVQNNCNLQSCPSKLFLEIPVVKMASGLATANA